MPAVPGGGGGLAPNVSRKTILTSWTASIASRRASGGAYNDTLARFVLGRKTTWGSTDAAGGISTDVVLTNTLGGSPVDYDLLAGVTDPSGGGTITFAKVRLLVLHALPTNLHTMKFLDSAATNPWNAAGKDLVLAPDGLLILENQLVAGYAVTSGSKVLRVSGTSGDQFELYIGGS